MKISLIIQSILSLSLLFPSISVALPRETLVTLPKETREKHFKQVKREFDRRWKAFSAHTVFTPWSYGRSPESIIEEFNALEDKRRSAWFKEPYAEVLEAKPDYQISQVLVTRRLYRLPHIIGFEYNLTDESYNANSIVMGDKRFIALEGPKPEFIPAFYNLMVNQRVTHLVRLTPEMEGATQKCAPYWENRVVQKNGHADIIEIPQGDSAIATPYAIPYYAIEDWLDDTPGMPEKLLKFIKQVKNDIDPNQENLIAVHCSGGVSRTSTFITTYLLLRDIDKQRQAGVPIADIKVNIHKTVAQLSLQRPFAIAVPSQYRTVYDMIDKYIDELRIS
ncbi:MAG: hypothetical protein RLZ35_239 [Pseudomonadota bacterium]|jgi:hypothetical protein